MRQVLHATLLCALLSLLLISLSACSGRKTQEDNTAAMVEKNFRTGEEQFEQNNYQAAIASWEKVRDAFYLPELSVLAELKIAESYFILERYDEAAISFKQFLKEHPDDPRAVSVQYRLGLCYYEQMRPADRDQSFTRQALTTFEDLVHRFPASQQSRQALSLIEKCRTRLLEHEVTVGDYYLKSKKYKAASKRYLTILQAHPDYQKRDNIYLNLVKACLGSGQTAKAKEISARLSKEFPATDQALEAARLIEKQN